MPSWLTGTGSVETGNDSALTATGVCAPLHPDFIKDGTSFLTGNESVLTATTPDPCDVPPPAPEPAPDGFIWYQAYGGVDKYLKDPDTNRVSLWINQFPPDIDAAAVDSNGVATLPINRPTWTPNVANGLPMLLWGGYPNPSSWLMKVYPPGTLNMPTVNGSPITLFAVVKFLDEQGGNVMTMRLNNDDLEMGYRKYDGPEAIPISSAQDAHAWFTPRTDYTGQLLLMSWTYKGAGPGNVPIVTVNGVPLAMSSSQLLTTYTGVSGVSIGFCNAFFNQQPNAYFGEILAYNRVLSAEDYTTTEDYLKEIWGIVY